MFGAEHNMFGHGWDIFLCEMCSSVEIGVREGECLSAMTFTSMREGNGTN